MLRREYNGKINNIFKVKIIKAMDLISDLVMNACETGSVNQESTKFECLI